MNIRRKEWMQWLKMHRNTSEGMVTSFVHVLRRYKVDASTSTLNDSPKISRIGRNTLFDAPFHNSISSLNPIFIVVNELNSLESSAPSPKKITVEFDTGYISTTWL